MLQIMKESTFDGFRLAWMLAKRDLKNRYATSYAGVAWNVGVPLLNALVTVVVFSILMAGRMGDRYNDAPFPLFFFVPFILWMLFTEIVGRSPNILKEHAYLINKIAFPVWVLPLVPIASALLSQAVLLVLVAGLFFINGVMPELTSFYFPLLWALALLWAIGVSYMIAALGVYIPDLAQAVPVVLNILFWLTPILYPPNIVEAGATTAVRALIMDFNPFFYFVESARQVVLVGGSAPWSTFCLLALIAGLSLAIGWRVYRRLQPGFADVL